LLGNKIKILLAKKQANQYLAAEIQPMRFLRLNLDFLDHPCSF